MIDAAPSYVALNSCDLAIETWTECNSEYGLQADIEYEGQQTDCEGLDPLAGGDNGECTIALTESSPYVLYDPCRGTFVQGHQTGRIGVFLEGEYVCYYSEYEDNYECHTEYRQGARAP